MEPGNCLRITTLASGWRDKDSVLLHACFQLLCDFLAQELDESQPDADSSHRAAHAELRELHQWWMAKRGAEVPNEADYAVENAKLKRLIDLRWAMWT